MTEAAVRRRELGTHCAGRDNAERALAEGNEACDLQMADGGRMPALHDRQCTPLARSGREGRDAFREGLSNMPQIWDGRDGDEKYSEQAYVCVFRAESK